MGKTLVSTHRAQSPPCSKLSKTSRVGCRRARRSLRMASSRSITSSQRRTRLQTSKPRKMMNPFKESVKDYKRFNTVAGADKFEDALPGFKDEKDLKALSPGYYVELPGTKSNILPPA